MFVRQESRIIRTTLILFFIVLVGYAIYEAQGILYGPQITLSVSSGTVQEQLFTIRGTAVRITELRLNGSPIPVTEQGAFEETYLLAPGSNHIILEAQDARGRHTKETLDVQFTGSNPTVTSQPTSTPPTTTASSTATSSSTEPL